jgi:hypothetical protein
LAIVFDKPTSRLKQKLGLKQPKTHLWGLSEQDSNEYKKYKTINVLIHQSGGNLLSRLTYDCYNVELTLQNIESRVGSSEFNTLQLISFVRNPYDKVVAHYLYQCRYRLATRQYPIAFDDWLEMTHSENVDLFMHNNPFQFLSQSTVLKNQNGEIDLAFIGRFEKFYTDVEQLNLLGIVKIKIPLIKTLNTTSLDYKEFYNTRTKKIVADWYEEDLDIFNYTF